MARPASHTPAPPRPAPPRLPARGPPPERVRAHPRAGRSARPARGAPFAPSTYLWRPRPARAARSPTTIGRPSRPGRRRQPERPPRLSRVGRTRLPRGRAEGGSWRCTTNPWARPPRIGESAERAEAAANRRRRALEASACSPIARPRGRDQKLRPRPRSPSQPGRGLPRGGGSPRGAPGTERVGNAGNRGALGTPGMGVWGRVTGDAGNPGARECRELRVLGWSQGSVRLQSRQCGRECPHRNFSIKIIKYNH